LAPVEASTAAITLVRALASDAVVFEPLGVVTPDGSAAAEDPAELVGPDGPGAPGSPRAPDGAALGGGELVVVVSVETPAVGVVAPTPRPGVAASSLAVAGPANQPPTPPTRPAARLTAAIAAAKPAPRARLGVRACVGPGFTMPSSAPGWGGAVGEDRRIQA
jgi:hypothetical protein